MQAQENEQAQKTIDEAIRSNDMLAQALAYKIAAHCEYWDSTEDDKALVQLASEILKNLY